MVSQGELNVIILMANVQLVDVSLKHVAAK